MSGLLLAGLMVAAACSKQQADDITGETHFLKVCRAESNDCGSGLACLCGVCTRACESTSDCAAYSSAECIDAAAACTPMEPLNRCDVRCNQDTDCRVVSDSHRCQGGYCRVGAEACARGEVPGNQVVVLGDSFMGQTHQITAGVEGLARAAGALPASERYRDESSLLDNALAAGGPGILNQYERALADAHVQVVIMNGGGTDMLAGLCEEPPLPSCPVIDASVTAARELFVRMAAGGVAHVVYAFYPDPVDPAVRGRMDVLRPLIETVCAESPVPCHFLDLRVAFDGRYAEYIAPDGLNPTAAGSLAAADAIWAKMQEFCVAQ